ncbi:sodium-dependent transporter [candidate division KSB1 bacterium]|nr:sodium-dependent transporter [candidate division KSB1 bacterium]
MSQKEVFSSRWALILAALGMAIGTGNIWRFPRILASNGGGAFLIPWAVFLFLWSIPLLITEFAIGKHTRKGPAGAFGELIGKRFIWMGCFVGFCTLAIMCYYSVVMGWCVKYFLASFQNLFTDTNIFAAKTDFWQYFLNSRYQPLVLHLASMAIGAYIIYNGVVKGIERTNRILIPSLLVLIIIAVIRALTLDGAVEGLNYFFNPDWKMLLNHKIWLDGLSQSAWSTGAGWGLVLTYATYMRKREDIVLNSFITGFGNNSASLLSGLALFPAVFALAPKIPLDAATELAKTGPASTGLTFIWMPKLFAEAPLGKGLCLIFFLVLSFAALSSLISMLELGTRSFMDAGMTRKSAVLFVAISGFIIGAPSAISMDFFENQDWVWSIGLTLSGFFFAFAVIKFGPTRFRKKIINTPDNDIQIGIWYDIVVAILIPLEFVVLIVWWFYQALDWQLEWWNPFRVFSIGTCIFQWAAVIGLFLWFNRSIGKKLIPERN